MIDALKFLASVAVVAIIAIALLWRDARKKGREWSPPMTAVATVCTGIMWVLAVPFIIIAAPFVIWYRHEVAEHGHRRRRR